MREFITTWKTDNPGGTNDNQIIISPIGNGYEYTIDWGDGHIDNGVTGDITHTYDSAGTYTVAIVGSFPQLYFYVYDNQKLLSVEQWGDIEWRSLSRAFFMCKNLSLNATDAPNLSRVTDMSFMFYEASTFNQDISDWDVSSVTNMEGLFKGAKAFNQDISDWDISSVKNTRGMFNRARAFNQDISGWDVSKVTDMRAMFNRASAFNQDISNWNVSSVTTMQGIFHKALAFNQDISCWDVSSVTNMKGEER